MSSGSERREGAVVQGDRLRKVFLRIHAAVLLFIATAMLVISTLGWQRGVGQFSFLQEDSFAYIPLYKAYLLMDINAIVLILGSRGTNVWRWNLFGAVIHLVPLTANFAAISIIYELNLTKTMWISIVLHSAIVAFELFALAWPSLARRTSPESEAPAVGVAGERSAS